MNQLLRIVIVVTGYCFANFSIGASIVCPNVNAVKNLGIQSTFTKVVDNANGNYSFVSNQQLITKSGKFNVYSRVKSNLRDIANQYASSELFTKPLIKYDYICVYKAEDSILLKNAAVIAILREDYL
jgi:hypothetical protein